MAATPGRDRFPGAELFLDDAGQLNENARRAWHRVRADLLYLSLWRAVGVVEAGRRVCEKHGHMPRGGRCDRCGALT